MPSVPSAMTLLVQVVPPSNVYASIRPANSLTEPASRFDVTTMFFGSVGFTATVCSFWLPARWLTFMLGGIRCGPAGEAAAAAAVDAAARNHVSARDDSAPAITRRRTPSDMAQLLPRCRPGGPVVPDPIRAVLALNAGRGRRVSLPPGGGAAS